MPLAESELDQYRTEWHRVGYDIECGWTSVKVEKDEHGTPTQTKVRTRIHLSRAGIAGPILDAVESFVGPGTFDNRPTPDDTNQGLPPVQS